MIGIDANTNVHSYVSPNANAFITHLVNCYILTTHMPNDVIVTLLKSHQMMTQLWLNISNY